MENIQDLIKELEIIVFGSNNSVIFNCVKLIPKLTGEFEGIVLKDFEALKGEHNFERFPLLKDFVKECGKNYYRGFPSLTTDELKKFLRGHEPDHK